MLPQSQILEEFSTSKATQASRLIKAIQKWNLQFRYIVKLSEISNSKFNEQIGIKGGEK